MNIENNIIKILVVFFISYFLNITDCSAGWS